MGYLDRFRILERTTVSNKKKYFPQVFLYTRTTTTGKWWWKKETELEKWRFIKYDRANNYKFDIQWVEDSEVAFFYNIEEAKEAIEKFKLDMKEKAEQNNDNNFVGEPKIINLD